MLLLLLLPWLFFVHGEILEVCGRGLWCAWERAGGWDCADGDRGVEGGLGWDLLEEGGEGLGADYGGIGKEFKLGFDGSDGTIDLSGLELAAWCHDGWLSV